MLREPALGLAEIARRWSFAAAGIALAVFSWVEYLDSLPVGPADTFLLRTRRPFLIAQAIAHVLRGSASRFVLIGIITCTAIAIAWVVTTSIGRGLMTIWLFDDVRLPISDAAAVEPSGVAPSYDSRDPALASIFGLNFLRAALTLAAIVGFAGAMVIAGLDSARSPAEAQMRSQLFMGVASLVWMLWWVISRFLSFAMLFAVRDRRGAFPAIAAAVQFFQSQMADVLAIGSWYGLAQAALFFSAFAFALMAMALSSLLHPGLVFVIVLLIALLYLAGVDWLHAGRLAACVALIERPAPQAAVIATPPVVSSPLPEKSSAAAPPDNVTLPPDLQSSPA